MRRLLAIVLALAGCDGTAVLTPSARAALSALAPDPLPAPPGDITNRWADDAGAAALGAKLFSETAFSGPLLDADHDGGPQSLGLPGDTGKIACASCHLPESGFSDTRSFMRQISLGAGWGRRRAPSLLDVGQARLLMWDGRRDALYDQPFGPLESVVEMNSSRLFMAEQLFKLYRVEYEALFGPMPPLDDAAQFPPLAASLSGCQPTNPTSPPPHCDGSFHGMPGDGAEYDSLTAENQDAVTRVVANAGRALGAYERTLACGPSAFDHWMHGAAAPSAAVEHGAALFVGKADCVRCHSGPFLSDQAFHNVGLHPEEVQQNFIDDGDRGAATGLASLLADPLNSRGVYGDGDDGRVPGNVTPQMEGAFRTPTLRCVSGRPTFMHTGQLGSLAEVVAFFNRGGDGGGYPGTKEIHLLGLTADEQSDLVAFLNALDGE